MGGGEVSAEDAKGNPLPKLGHLGTVLMSQNLVNLDCRIGFFSIFSLDQIFIRIWLA